MMELLARESLNRRRSALNSGMAEKVEEEEFPDNLIEETLRRGTFLCEKEKAWVARRLRVEEWDWEKRKKAWLVLADVAGNKTVHKELYAQLEGALAGEGATFRQIIVMDVRRTSPTLSEAQRNSLIRVLFSLVKRNGRVAYCQGMNFIAELLFVQLGFDEEETFWMMSYLPEILGESYHTNLVWLMADVGVFGMMFRLARGDEARALEKLGVDLPLLAFPWFVTLFSKLRDVPLRSQIFESFLMTGPAALVQAAVAVASAAGRRARRFRTLNEFYKNYEALLDDPGLLATVSSDAKDFFVDPSLYLKLRAKAAKIEWRKARELAKQQTSHPLLNRCSLASPVCALDRAELKRERFETSGNPPVFRTGDLLKNLDPEYFLPSTPVAVPAPIPSAIHRSQVSRRTSASLSPRAPGSYCTSRSFSEPRTLNSYPPELLSELLYKLENEIGYKLVVARSKHRCAFSLLDQAISLVQGERIKDAFHKVSERSPETEASQVQSPSI